MKTNFLQEKGQLNPPLNIPNEKPLFDQNNRPQPGAEDRDRWRIEDSDYTYLRNAILDLLSIDLAHYRTRQMERRLTTYLAHSGYSSWMGYVQLLYKRPEKLQAFLKFLTINVSSFYRDGDKWDYLTRSVLPDLLHKTSPQGIQAWSIGCSMGAEPYTLAMLLNDFAPERRHQIRASDIDSTVLEQARNAGPYSPNALREMPQELIEKYLVASGKNQFRVHTNIRNFVTFEQFDLLQNSTTRLYDLVLCRNLVIYFPTSVKECVFMRLAQTVKPGGILFIGSTETITHYRHYGFNYLAPSFYQRTA